MENETSPWVPQENGTYLPSADLIQRVRENPDQFPNAIEDFTALSGLPRDQVEAMIANPLRAGGFANNGVLGAPARGADAVIRGLGQAGGYALDNLGLPGGDTVRDLTGNNDVFETEKSTGEKVGEVVGQVAPTVAAGLATPGLVAGTAVAGGVSTLTFSEDDNLANLANDYVDGAVPDFLTHSPEDDSNTKLAKNLAANLVVDAAFLGATKAVAKVYRVFKDGTASPEVVQQIAEEAGVPLRAPAEAAEVPSGSAARVVADTAEIAADDLPTAQDVAVIRKGRARDDVAANIVAKETGQPLPVEPVVPQDVAQVWRQETLGPVQRLLNRSREVNTGLKGSIDNFEAGPAYQQYVRHSEETLRAVAQNNTDEVIRLARMIDQMPDASTVGAVYKNAILKESLTKLDDNFMEIVEKIRQDPSLKTKVAYKDLAADYHERKVRLGELYRETGSSSAYAFLVRRGVKFDDSILAPLKDAEADLAKQLKDQGYNLFSSKAEFIAGRTLSLREMGFDALPILDDLYKQFDEFDRIRAGALDNMSVNAMSKMTKAQREQAENTWLRFVHELHSSALLGQPSTAGLEIMTNTINNLLNPITQNIFTRGDFGRWYREYTGYAFAASRGWDTFKKGLITGRSVTDDFDIIDNAHSGVMDYQRLKDNNNFAGYVAARLWKFASDLSVASSEAQKAWRGMGVAYADGLELALKQGATPAQAKKMALDYANSMFDENGAFKDVALKLDVQQTSWQSVFDTRYATGKIGQAVDNLRNSQNAFLSIASRAAVPFWRTLANIASHSLQTVQPIPASVLKPLLRTQWGSKVAKTAKFLDDFTGNNGYAAQQRAVGRQRLGLMTMGSVYALAETGAIDVTGPSGFKRWDAKLAENQEYPGSSIIFKDGTAIDLTRLLPFSAPFLLVGLMRDMSRENQLQMKDANWVAPDDSAYDMAVTYGSALWTLSYSMMSDAASFQGVGNLFDAINKAAADGDPRQLIKFAEDYAKQFTPGAVRTFGKNQGLYTGDWTQHQAEGFLNEALASAGWHTGYTRVDFLGHPVEDALRGIDPLNTRSLKVADDPLRQEYVILNKAADLALSLDKPDKVFDKEFWQGLGQVPSTVDWLFSSEAPSLTQMSTKDGANAWERYRDIVYKGRASADLEKNVTGTDKALAVVIKKGENFEQALRRTIEMSGYDNLTPEYRVAVFKEIFGVFKKAAKDELKATLKVSPDLFKNSRYGSPITSDALLGDVQKLGKANAIQTNVSRGNPLDDIFSIKR